MNALHDFSELQEIHHSQNSIIWAGTDPRTGQKVAVKVLNRDYPSATSIARFNEEAELSERFDIKGVRKIIEKRKINNRPALVMEYIEGKSFQELIRNREISLGRFLRLAIDATRVIGEIHKHGIIHKDINPRNLLVDLEERVHLIDLGIASLYKREMQKLEAPERLVGTLAYISPEQTGRMNHSIDARADLYSLGITFYEMLTGGLPFDTTSPMELVHSHIARIPETPQERQPDLPIVLSKIVMKLIAKDVEERYQTAEGLRADLDRCFEVWRSEGIIVLQTLDFDLGKEDFSPRFYIPEKLYGRDVERAELLDYFLDTEAGSLAFLTVSGRSGIGKTALVRELYKPVTEKRSYFLAGKFEQFTRDVPYSAIITAINGLVQQLLGESDRRLAHWRREIIDALGNNAGVLTELIPSLELIIGKQPVPMQLAPIESQNRFNNVFKNFFKYLSTYKHSFVLFIDDWQWADLPSLNLLRHLMTDHECKYLLFIAAYRNNEIDATHPLMACIADIRKVGTPHKEFVLEELAQRDIEELLLDTLHAPYEMVRPLAELVKAKTSGNPFFVSQFLQNLYEGGVLEYDYEHRRWHWDLLQIKTLPLSDNVLALMTARLNTLSSETLSLLQLAACIGNDFSLKLLSEVAGKSQIEVRQALLEALEQGFILPSQGNHYLVESEEDMGVHFQFLHDRVEQAAREYISREEYAKVRWKIGQIILRTASDVYIQDNLFDVVNYLNSGRFHARTDEEKYQLADLNYQAGKRAKRATAYDTAETLFLIAIDRYGGGLWSRQYERAFDMHKELAEIFFMQGNFSDSEVLLNGCLKKARNIYEKSDLYKIKIALLSGQGKYREAVQTTIDAVVMFGIDWPSLTEEDRIQEIMLEEIEFYSNFTYHKGIAALADLPECQNEEIKVAMELLALAMDCAAIGVPSVLGLLCMKMINLTIQHGMAGNSAFAMMLASVVYASGFRDFKSAKEISNLACRIAESRADAKHTLAKLYHLYAYHGYLTCDIRTAGEYNRKAFEKGLELGDFVYASYSIAVFPRFILPISIDKMLEHAQSAYVFLKKLNNVPMMLTSVMQMGFAQCMKGTSDAPNTFDCVDFDEQQYLRVFGETAPSLVAVYKRFKIIALYCKGFYEQAMTLVEERAMWIDAFGGIDIPLRGDYRLFAGLTVVRLQENASEKEQKYYYEIFDESLTEIESLYEVSQNFAPHYFLLKAEEARMKHQSFEALDFYDKAIEAAGEQDTPQYIAVATERAGEFFLKHKKEDIAKLYLRKAYRAYEIWGASAKLALMRDRYKEHIATRKGNPPTYTETAIVTMKETAMATNYGDSSLDIASVMKASQAISQEIKLDLLLENVMRVLMENAGAERALLIHEQDGDLFVVAESSIYREEIQILRATPLNKSDKEHLALNIIRQSYRRQETFVLNNPKKDNRFAMDLYVQQNSVKSILCLPIAYQGKVRLLIYMEHNQIEGAFTTDRIEVLNMLSSQLAISLENAMLYETMEQKVEERTRELASKTDELASANIELERKNSKITASIKYALSMQQAILPTDADLQKITPDFFVLYLPKDIVSGDFYWYAHINDTFVIAAIDCTGHGVPGAFMSMIANTLLDEIVNQKEIIEPADILEQLHKGVRIALHQDVTSNDDGMDLSLCVLEKIKRGGVNISFVGAKSPFYMVSNGVFRLVEGDRRSIGGDEPRKVRPFTTHRIKLKKDDAFYLSTDGFVDQAGGKYRNNFGKVRLGEVMKAHWQQPMQKQKEVFLHTLIDYQGTIPQRDDITLLGFRVG